MALRIETEPKRIWSEPGEFARYLNFDFLLTNTGEERIQLEEITAEILDSDGGLAMRRAIDRNAVTPSLNTIETRELGAGVQAVIFNPFHTFPLALSLDTIRFTFLYTPEGKERQHAVCSVHPRDYLANTRLRLPMRGKLLVYDGHDYLSHHRRIDLFHPVMQLLGMQTNSVRYAIDFCALDSKDRLFTGEGASAQDWLSWGAPVNAPGAGVALQVQNDVPDNRLGEGYAFSEQEILADPSLMLGNYVVIDHQNGEYSWLVHLRQGSVQVSKGEAVLSGQGVGQVGFSGDSGSFVHLHYMLTDNLDSSSMEGLPPRFQDFKKKRGGQWVEIGAGCIETGEVLWGGPELE